MKKIALVFALMAAGLVSAFAQNDLQPLAVVKLNKSETITLKELKNRVSVYQKMTGAQTFTAEQKKEILDALVAEKLITQQAAKEGKTLSDSQVDTYFQNVLSQQAGRQVTEEQFSELLKESQGVTLDQYMKDSFGLSLSEYKHYLKAQLVTQNYIQEKKANELKAVVATNEEITSFYNMNKAQFVQSDARKLFLVIYPKGNDAAKAKTAAQALYNDYKNKKQTAESIKSSSDNGKLYQAGDMIVQNSALHAQQLGITSAQLQELFGRGNGYISELAETQTDYQFYVVLKSYSAKMLSPTDPVQPESTVTVYDYIRENLSQQKKSQYLIQATQELTKSLNTAENVSYKKTGDALLKLLNW